MGRAVDRGRSWINPMTSSRQILLWLIWARFIRPSHNTVLHISCKLASNSIFADSGSLSSSSGFSFPILSLYMSVRVCFPPLSNLDKRELASPHITIDLKHLYASLLETGWETRAKFTKQTAVPFLNAGCLFLRRLRALPTPSLSAVCRFTLTGLLVDPMQSLCVQFTEEKKKKRIH